MRRLLIVSVTLNLGLIAWIAARESTAHASGGVGIVALKNGDVNGDGKIDSSDATYLLAWLFTGGPAPAPIPAGLPATGQTKCYDDQAKEVDCASTDFPGQDGSYQAGCPSTGRFVDNGDGTVTDKCTGLMWQKDTADVNGDGVIDGDDEVSPQKSLKYCEHLDLGGYTDWRLPNVRELQSMVDYGRFNPAIDPIFGAMGNGYWSSSTFPATDIISTTWGVGFLDGSVLIGAGVGGGGSFVRAVRGGL